MPLFGESSEKLYFTIGEVAKLFDVNTSLIRFWEKEFPILKPKNNKGNRLFTRTDVDNLRKIYHLVKERGYTLHGANEELKEHKEEFAQTAEVLKSLNKIKNSLQKLHDEL
jgi:DNA-binding transcriptional MerR regulator